MSKYITLYFFKTSISDKLIDYNLEDRKQFNKNIYSLIIPLNKLIKLYDILGKDTERLERFIDNKNNDDEEGFFISFFKEFFDYIIYINTQSKQKEYEELKKFNKFLVDYLKYNKTNLTYHIYNIYDFKKDEKLKKIDWKERFKYLIDLMNKNKAEFINEYDSIYHNIITHMDYNNNHDKE